LPGSEQESEQHPNLVHSRSGNAQLCGMTRIIRIKSDK
jgi:hypothetical protein